MLVDYSLGLTPTPTINQVNVVHLYNTHKCCFYSLWTLVVLVTSLTTF